MTGCVTHTGAARNALASKATAKKAFWKRQLQANLLEAGFGSE